MERSNPNGARGMSPFSPITQTDRPNKNHGLVFNTAPPKIRTPRALLSHPNHPNTGHVPVGRGRLLVPSGARDGW